MLICYFEYSIYFLTILLWFHFDAIELSTLIFLPAVWLAQVAEMNHMQYVTKIGCENFEID